MTLQQYVDRLLAEAAEAERLADAAIGQRAAWLRQNAAAKRQAAGEIVMGMRRWELEAKSCGTWCSTH